MKKLIYFFLDFIIYLISFIIAVATFLLLGRILPEINPTLALLLSLVSAILIGSILTYFLHTRKK